MYFNYKNIDDNIKISLMALEGYISFNRLKDYKEINVYTNIIYNEKFISEKKHEKTEMIIKLEDIVNKIVNFELNKGRTIEEINILLNKTSSQNIKKVIINPIDRRVIWLFAKVLKLPTY